MFSEIVIWFREPTCGRRDNSNNDLPIRLGDTLLLAASGICSEINAGLGEGLALLNVSYLCNHSTATLCGSSL